MNERNNNTLKTRKTGFTIKKLSFSWVIYRKNMLWMKWMRGNGWMLVRPKEVGRGFQLKAAEMKMGNDNLLRDSMTRIRIFVCWLRNNLATKQLVKGLFQLSKRPNFYTRENVWYGEKGVWKEDDSSGLASEKNTYVRIWQVVAGHGLNKLIYIRTESNILEQKINNATTYK